MFTIESRIQYLKNRIGDFSRDRYSDLKSSIKKGIEEATIASKHGENKRAEAILRSVEEDIMYADRFPETFR